MTGSRRLFSHRLFPELHWGRNPFLSSIYTLPPGFDPFRKMLSDELIQILEDIHGLQDYAETSSIDYTDAVEVLQLDNHQAWVESGLHECFIETSEENHFLRSCILASYLCAYTLFTGIWGDFSIPYRISTDLLFTLRGAYQASNWKEYRYVLLWCTIIGGTFSHPGVSRLGYVQLLHRSGFPTFSTTWKDMSVLLKTFFWSKKQYDVSGGAFWEACLTKLDT
jgi:hypothetical protein